MIRIEYSRFGGPETMHIADFALPLIKANQVKIAVKASSINEIDWKLRQGYLKAMSGPKFPKGMGMDFAGVVIEAGANQPFKVGDEVFGGKPIKGLGSFAEELIANAKDIVKKPGNVSFEDAATLPAVGSTAWQALIKHGNITEGDSVFINGAYGAMGQFAVQLAKARGASRIVARVSPEDFKGVKDIGATEAISYKEPVPDKFNGSFDIVYDTHGSLEPEVQSRIVNKGGKILDVVPFRNKVFRAVISPKRKIVFGSMKPEILSKLATLADKHGLVIHIGQKVNLANALVAIESLEKGKRIKGKTVIVN